MTIKLICFDMDGVIFQDVNFWMEVHRRFGTLEEGKKLTRQYLHTDYNRLVEEVVTRLWKGRDASPYYELVKSVPYLPGVREVFREIKRFDYQTAVISASSIDLARRAQHELGIDHIFANELVIKDGKVSGEFLWPIGAGKHKKAEIIRNLCSDLGISQRDVAYIGDSDTDIEAFQEVGLSIAFNSESEELKRVATYVIDDHDLRNILPYIR